MNRSRCVVFILLTLVLCSPSSLAQLYVEGGYGGSRTNMNCWSQARYMSGAFDWTIDYYWTVTAIARIDGPRSNMNSAMRAGEAHVGTSVSTGGPTDLPAGCYDFGAEGRAVNTSTGVSSPDQGGRLGALCFDDPIVQPPPVILWVYSDIDGSTALLSTDFYPPLTRVTLSAFPPNGYRFVGWTGGITSLENPVTFILGQSMSVTANFRINTTADPGGGVPLTCDENGVCRTPIVIDLDGSDTPLSGLDDPVTFDIDGNGSPDSMAWTQHGSRVAFLTLDRDGNGIIADGRELFGDASRPGASNGFEALEAFDADHNGVIDSADPIWAELRLWVDANHDGVSASGELLPLSHTDIRSLDLDRHWLGRRDRHGNAYRWQATLTRSGNRRQPYYDVYLRVVTAPTVVVSIP